MLSVFSRPQEIGVYVNTGKRKIQAIQKELDTDLICNLQLFNPNWTACCFTKVDGEVIGDDGYIYEGFGWNKTDGVLTFDTSNHHSKYENFVGCLTVVKNGKYPVNPIPSALSGRRGRTAIGTKKDGSILVYCVPDSQGITIPDLAQKLIGFGCEYAINFDGGGSSQCLSEDGSVTTSRIVHTLFYMKSVCKQEKPMNTITVKELSAGSKEKKWIKSAQQLLIAKGYSCGWCGADGDFGGGTQSAVNYYKINHGLARNGKIDAEMWQSLLGG